MNTPTTDQLTTWVQALDKLQKWQLHNVSLFNQSDFGMLNAMCNHAGIEPLNFSCQGCMADGFNRLARIYKDFI